MSTAKATVAGFAVVIVATHPTAAALWLILGMTVFYSVRGHKVSWIKRRPLRRRHRVGPWSVNTSDARITSTTHRAVRTGDGGLNFRSAFTFRLEVRDE